MSKEHPITPPPELRRLWAQQAQRMDPRDPVAWQEHVATQAARWGADQELEACCAYLVKVGLTGDACGLQLTRRPKPPSLKEQALEARQRMWDGGVTREDWELVRRALEQLDD